MSVRDDIVGAAERVADDAIEAVIEAIRDAIQDRRDNALWWWHFHTAMLATLPKWRWLARLHHRRCQRRRAADVRANRALASVCPGAKAA